MLSLAALQRFCVRAVGPIEMSERLEMADHPREFVVGRAGIRLREHLVDDPVRSGMIAEIPRSHGTG